MGDAAQASANCHSPRSSIWRSGARRGWPPSRRCGCSSICPTCSPVTSRSCTTPRARTTASPRATWPACSPSASVSTARPGRGRLLPRRRGREQDQPAEHGAASACSSRSRSATTPRRRRAAPSTAARDGLVIGEGRGRAGPGRFGARPPARRPHLRRRGGGRFWGGVRTGRRAAPVLARAIRAGAGPTPNSAPKTSITSTPTGL